MFLLQINLKKLLNCKTTRWSVLKVSEPTSSQINKSVCQARAIRYLFLIVLSLILTTLAISLTVRLKLCSLAAISKATQQTTQSLRDNFMLYKLVVASVHNISSSSEKC